jgi:hypothetical protein
MATKLVTELYGNKAGHWVIWQQSWLLSYMATKLVTELYGNKAGHWVIWQQSWSLSYMGGGVGILLTTKLVTELYGRIGHWVIWEDRHWVIWEGRHWVIWKDRSQSYMEGSALSYGRVGILLTCGKHFHDRIISLKGEIWANKTS